MYTPTPDEKTTLAMVYTQNMFARGEVVTKESARVNTWLRTQGMPEYMHLLRVQVLNFGGGAVRSTSYPELYLPTARVIAFHPVPPTSDPLDYDEGEKNRLMVPVTALVGTFLFKGKLRISSQTGLATSIESARSQWFSIYEVDVSNPGLPQMPVLHVPMILVHPRQVCFTLEAA